MLHNSMFANKTYAICNIVVVILVAPDAYGITIKQKIQSF